MDIAKKEFKALFKSPMEAEGFTYAGNTFFRHINDVLQTLTLRKTFCTLEFRFGIFPICIPISGFLPCGIHRVFGGPYEKQTIHEVMEQAFSVVLREIVPVFQKGADSKSAYSAIMDFRKKVYPPDAASHDLCLKWMALKNRDYASAYIQQYCTIALQLGLIRYGTTLSDIMVPEVRKQIEEITEDDPSDLSRSKYMLDRIAQKDDKFFQELIERNTQVTLDFLQKVKKSPCKYGKGDYLLF